MDSILKGTVNSYFKTGSLMNQYSPLKIKIDSILNKDYQNWRTAK